jgi:transcriptional regulator with XRE-family HTH domain
MTSKNTPPDHATLEALLAMLKAGQCTQAEAAKLAGRSRQAVAQWLEGFDTVAARQEYLQRKLAMRLSRRSR